MSRYLGSMQNSCVVSIFGIEDYSQRDIICVNRVVGSALVNKRAEELHCEGYQIYKTLNDSVLFAEGGHDDKAVIIRGKQECPFRCLIYSSESLTLDEAGYRITRGALEFILKESRRRYTGTNVLWMNQASFKSLREAADKKILVSGEDKHNFWKIFHCVSVLSKLDGREYNRIKALQREVIMPFADSQLYFPSELSNRK